MEHATVSAVSTSKSGMVELHTAAGTSFLDMDGADPRRAVAALNPLSAEGGWEVVAATRVERSAGTWSTDYLMRRPSTRPEVQVYRCRGRADGRPMALPLFRCRPPSRRSR